MTGLHIEDIAVAHGPMPVLQGVNLAVSENEVVALLGPSGSGKTTLLRTIAGLQRPNAGRIRWNTVDLTDVAIHKRGMGLMFQNSALFPHRNVKDNVGFGLRVSGVSVAQRGHRVEEMLRFVGLGGFSGRSVGTLSGGEAQRVALARALAPRPRILLLDEPFGSLDRALRIRLIVEVGELLRSLGQTALHVTHDRDEAFAVADRIAVLGDGCIQRIGTPEEVWAQPRSAYVARSLGHENIVELDASGRCALGRLAERDGTVLIHGDRVKVDRQCATGSTSGTVIESVFRGDTTLIRVQIGDLVIGVPSTSMIDCGAQVTVTLRPGSVVPLD